MQSLFDWITCTTGLLVKLNAALKLFNEFFTESSSLILSLLIANECLWAYCLHNYICDKCTVNAIQQQLQLMFYANLEVPHLVVSALVMLKWFWTLHGVIKFSNCST